MEKPAKRREVFRNNKGSYNGQVANMEEALQG